MQSTQHLGRGAGQTHDGRLSVGTHLATHAVPCCLTFGRIACEHSSTCAHVRIRSFTLRFRRRLTKLVDDYGRAMTPYQLGCALALLAGFASGRVMRDAGWQAGGHTRLRSMGGGGGPNGSDGSGATAVLSPRERRAQEMVAACRSTAQRCADLLRGRINTATALDCARYGDVLRHNLWLASMMACDSCSY
jgi:hypothetical protein